MDFTRRQVLGYSARALGAYALGTSALTGLLTAGSLQTVGIIIAAILIIVIIFAYPKKGAKRQGLPKGVEITDLKASPVREPEPKKKKR